MNEQLLNVYTNTNYSLTSCQYVEGVCVGCVYVCIYLIKQEFIYPLFDYSYRRINHLSTIHGIFLYKIVPI